MRLSSGSAIACVILFVLCGNFLPCYSQNMELDSEKLIVSRPAQSPIADDLVEVDLGKLSLLMPSGLRNESSNRCIEGGCWRFAGRGVTIDIDFSKGAWHPLFERLTLGVDYETFTVDNVNTKYWTSQNGGIYSASAVYANQKNAGIGLGIYLQTENRDTRDNAKKIFSSVKFRTK